MVNLYLLNDELNSGSKSGGHKDALRGDYIGEQNG